MDFIHSCVEGGFLSQRILYLVSLIHVFLPTAYHYELRPNPLAVLP